MGKQNIEHTAVLIDDLRIEKAGLTVLLHKSEVCGDVVGNLQYKERLDEIAKELLDIVTATGYGDARS